jgi:predicted dehydrogenase
LTGEHLVPPTRAKHLLILGAGSVGKRHLRNFASLGADVSAMDPRMDRLEEARTEIALRSTFQSLDAALAQPRAFDGAVVCSPPSAHASQSIACLLAGLPLLIEKPLSPTLSSAREVAAAAKAAQVPVILGYTYRWWPPLADLGRALRAGDIGRPMSARCVMSAHLADWHPWERYQDFFMASASLGGGALLDESHFLDLMLWFFGTPSHVYARVEKLSDLQIDTDDNVDALLEYDSGLRVGIHLDLFGRPHEKSIRVGGERGSAEWTFDPNELRIGTTPEPVWRTQTYSNQRNDMFIAVAREFLEALDGSAVRTCTVEDGVKVLEVIEAMRSSSQTGRRVALVQGPA